MKRILDIVLASAGLVLTSPLLVPVLIAVWLQDWRSPFYIAPRMARGGGTFRMVKVRSMVVNADKTGVNSTAGNDCRITALGRFVRSYKIDEIPQLWNVLRGEMSLVGPRPQVKADAALYTSEEARLLSIRPGITDPASIVFSDEGDILYGSSNPDLLYNQIVRPWKSRLALVYVDNPATGAYLCLIALTALALVSKSAARRGVCSLLRASHADHNLCRIALRNEELRPAPPPGATEVVSF